MDDDNVDRKELERRWPYSKSEFAFGYTGPSFIIWSDSAAIAVGESIKDYRFGDRIGDIPRAILKWARRENLMSPSWRWIVTKPQYTRRRRPGLTRTVIVQDDVFNMGFGRRRFRYALTSLFLHHLDEDKIVEALRIMDRLAKRGLLRRICSASPCVCVDQLFTMLSSR